MAKSVSFDNAQDWEEYYYNQGLDFLINNQDLGDGNSICRCIRDNKDYITKNPPKKIKNKIGVGGKVSRYSSFNLQYKKEGDEVIKNEKAMSFHWLEHSDWNCNWEVFKKKYNYILYLKYFVETIKNMRIPLKQSTLDFEDIDFDELNWDDGDNVPDCIRMNVLPSPTTDDGNPELTHVSLFSFTNSEIICGENFYLYEEKIKLAFKMVDGIFDENHNEVSDEWKIE